MFTWTDFMPIRIKLFTNPDGKPELKIWAGNINDSDTPLKFNTANAFSWVDNNNTYPNAGKIRWVIGTGIGDGASINMPFELQNASLITQDVEGKIYVKTIVGDGAEDSVIYRSSLELFYDPI
jgi:hypothetical protein